MGFAGLDIAGLQKRLSRLGISCVVVEDDAAMDHCVLELTSVRREEIVALLEYENQGDGVRYAELVLDSAAPGESLVSTLELIGARRDDPEKLVEWLVRKDLLRQS
jgi:hypothetical protein